MRIVVINESDLNDAGEEVQHDVTQAVGALYDLAISSMDYGSGFWTAEDAVPVAHLARVCGYKLVDELEAYIAEQRRLEEQQRDRARQQARERRVLMEAVKDPLWIHQPDEEEGP